MKIGTREKVYIIVILIVFTLLTVKSLWIDGYKPETESEKYLMEALEKSIVDTEGFIKSSKVIRIAKMTDREIEVQSQKYKIEEGFRIKVRHYLFKILPYSQSSYYY